MFQLYAALMIVLYPVGVPVLFAVLLLKRRDQINPPLLKLPDSSPLLSNMSSDTALESRRGGGGGRGGSGDASGSGAAESDRAKGESNSRSVLSDGGEEQRRLQRFGGGGGGGGEERRSAKAFTAGITPVDREEVRACVRKQRGWLRERRREAGVPRSKKR